MQIRNINRQLAKRLQENTRQPISLELFNNELNSLAVNINKCLKAEELLRLKTIREQKQFKEMIANISHDLRTPLTALKGYQQLLAKETLSLEQFEKLKVAQKNTDELGILIEHFFEYSYILNTDLVMNVERINLTNLLTECLADSVANFEENNLTIKFEDSPSIYGLVDKDLAKRIIQNLIRNCSQHSTGDIWVKISTSQNVIISFRNPVKNASELDVTRLFERFYSSDKARGKFTGLGLSIVKLLSEQMGGNSYASLQDNEIDIQVELPLAP